jgi:N-acetylglutamate synthase-like GNAT family acetyltransferase
MISEAVNNDIESIADVMVCCWQTAFTGIIEPDDYPIHLKKKKFENIFKNNIDNHLEKIYVFEKSDKVVGMVSGKLNSGNYDSEIVGLYVHPVYQQNNIGSELLNRMKKYLHQEHCKNIIIWTLLNAKNNQFYLKHGGITTEKKELQFGSKKYTGVGFLFKL